MKLLPVRIVPTGKFVYTKIDDENFEWAKKFTWIVDSTIRGGYVSRRTGNKLIRLHRIVNNTPEGMDTDHINRDKLDNRKANLRSVPHKINSINQGLYATNTSGYKGVYKSGDKWCSIISDNGKLRRLGIFDTPKMAAVAFDRAALKINHLYTTNKVLGLL